MDKPRPCGCKGIRTCLVCENVYGIEKKTLFISEDVESYVYCPRCDEAWPGLETDAYKEHPRHKGGSIEFPGVYIQLDFLSIGEEDSLLKGIDEMQWDLSQSGRRKQNFGPKCNFKKQRIRVGDFQGFPLFSKFVQEKFKTVPILQGFHTVEQCSLEYEPLRGASIDPHIDDCWVWGERIVTVNLLSDCILTMSRYTGETSRYNLNCVPTYPPILNDMGKIVYQPFLSEEVNEPSSIGMYKEHKKSAVNVNETNTSYIVRIPMPRRSLLVLYGQARYNWEHSVLRQDVQDRRICLAYREFTPIYLEDGKYANVGYEVLNQAKKFWDHKFPGSVQSL